MTELMTQMYSSDSRINVQRASLILFSVILSFSFRLFFIDTNLFYVDGDEAILGLMGIDILSGDLPLYFYGQTYGFSLIEALLIAIGISVFGTTALAIKLPMLLLWSISLSFFALTTYHLTRKNFILSLTVVLALATLPTWMVWSMKARGGYLTALLCSSLVIYLLVVYRNKSNNWFWCLIGVFLIIIYEAQPLWFPVTFLCVFILPITFDEIPQNPARKLVLALVSASAIWMGLFLYKQSLFVVWMPPPLSFNHIIDDPLVVVRALNNHLNGLYYLSASFVKNTSVHSMIIWLITFTVMAYAGYQIYFKNFKKALIILLLPASMVGAVINPNPRYLLPYTLVLLFLFIVMVGNGSKRHHYLAILLLIALFISNIYNSPKYFRFSQMQVEAFDELGEPVNTTDNQIIQNLIFTLESKGVKNAIVRNDFLEYQINYFTRYGLLSIGKLSRTRQPKIIPDVELAYLKNPQQFAIVGYNWGYELSTYYPDVNGKLIYWLNPDHDALKQLDLLPIAE